MFRQLLFIATVFVSLFSLGGCFVGTYSTTAAYDASISNVVYYGPHPVFDENGDADWCSITGVHSHQYAPVDDEFFVVENGRYVFIGDPSYYVSDLWFDTYHYMGEHPLPFGNQWCYISGPHQHHWASSGYYNYSLIDSVHYYTYYGSRNIYYNPNHIHYDLRAYYTSHPPVRYRGSNRVSVGMRTPSPAPRPIAAPHGGPNGPRPIAGPHGGSNGVVSIAVPDGDSNPGRRPIAGSHGGPNGSVSIAVPDGDSNRGRRPISGRHVGPNGTRPANGFHVAPNGNDGNANVQPAGGSNGSRPVVSHSGPNGHFGNVNARPVGHRAPGNGRVAVGNRDNGAQPAMVNRSEQVTNEYHHSSTSVSSSRSESRYSSIGKRVNTSQNSCSSGDDREDNRKKKKGSVVTQGHSGGASLGGPAQGGSDRGGRGGGHHR